MRNRDEFFLKRHHGNQLNMLLFISSQNKNDNEDQIFKPQDFCVSPMRGAAVVCAGTELFWHLNEGERP
jgi:hypothetical protein